MKKEINIDNLPQYQPKTENGQRVYNFLLNYWNKNYEKLGVIYFTKEQLLNMFTSVGIGKTVPLSALKDLEKTIGCTSFWDSTEKTMKYIVYPMTPEEKIKVLEDAVWFEGL